MASEGGQRLIPLQGMEVLIINGSPRTGAKIGKDTTTGKEVPGRIDGKKGSTQ